MPNLEVGTFLIYVAIAVALAGVVFSVWGGLTGRGDLTESGKRATLAVLFLTTLAVIRP